ncbi:hypothetical protein B0H14DRAFT_2296931, partial [Mycena olivaceomarginata]
ERNRRANINALIDELGRLVLAGEMDKTAIISRAAQYIRHLKQNEVCNIEKHTLEKLLLEKAIDERKALLTNLRRMWEEECRNRQLAEQELEIVRKGMAES